MQVTFGFWLILLGTPVLVFIGHDAGWWNALPEEFKSAEEFIAFYKPQFFQLTVAYTGSLRNAQIIFMFLVLASALLLYRPAYKQVRKEHACGSCGAQWAVYPTGKIQRWDSKTSVSNYKKTEVAHSQIGKGLDERDIFKRRVTKKVSGFKINQCVVCGAKSAGDFDTSSTVLSDDVTAVGGWRKRK